MLLAIGMLRSLERVARLLEPLTKVGKGNRYRVSVRPGTQQKGKKGEKRLPSRTLHSRTAGQMRATDLNDDRR